ncbi:hypothetical protein DPX16_18180 [Anabarilius grahami]|uniref:Uncharacterized protein n=1 Tax=Anabarilius grahami TaxID=495550 RepID=A0A3N0Y940_ANAGA|nr:hypothetical protein DPX16_18180 [Anabarilius grahami]
MFLARNFVRLLRKSAGRKIVSYITTSVRFSDKLTRDVCVAIRSSDHPNSHRAAGITIHRHASSSSKNNPSACQFHASSTGNVAAQDHTVSLSAVEMSSAETAEEHPSPFANIRFGGLVENALVYIAGIVVRQIL